MKHITFDHITRDFAMELDGEIVGYATTRQEAQDRLDEIAYEQLVHAAQLTAVSVAA